MLVSCGPHKMQFSDEALCEPHKDQYTICGVQLPEDLTILPDQSGILISENGSADGLSGRVSLLNHKTSKMRILYDSDSSNDLTQRLAIWGEQGCQEPNIFSPHGFDLSQRPSGRWQLLAVNHGEQETIQMFELLKDEAFEWQLLWRGCVNAVDNSRFNDVAATNDGFVVTRMVPDDALLDGGLDLIFKRKTGVLWHWSIQEGMQIVPGSEGVFLNGVANDAGNGRYFVNVYGEDKLKVYDRNTKKYITSLNIPKADNTSWDIGRDNTVLVASQKANIFTLKKCLDNIMDNCSAAFNIIEINTQTLKEKIIFQSDEEYFGAASVAVRLGDFLYIGSFAGTRLLVAPVNEIN